VKAYVSRKHSAVANPRSAFSAVAKLLSLTSYVSELLFRANSPSLAAETDAEDDDDDEQNEDDDQRRDEPDVQSIHLRNQASARYFPPNSTF